MDYRIVNAGTIDDSSILYEDDEEKQFKEALKELARNLQKLNKEKAN